MSRRVNPKYDTQTTCLPSNCELCLPNFYASVLLEGLSVALLVFIGGLVSIRVDTKEHKYVVESAIVYGVTLATLVECLKDISDAHLNPAITIACVVIRRVSLLRGFCYIILQCTGGIGGALLLRQMVPSSSDKDYAMTRLSHDTSIREGIAYEIVFTFVYALLYFSFTSSKRNVIKTYNGSLAIGLFYGMSHIVIVDKTGCSLNPARSLGPAVVNKDYRDQWVYWVSPIVASCFAGLIHIFIFKRSKKEIYPRARSLSLVCCKPSREEATTRHYSNAEYIHRWRKENSEEGTSSQRLNGEYIRKLEESV